MCYPCGQYCNKKFSNTVKWEIFPCLIWNIQKQINIEQNYRLLSNLYFKTKHKYVCNRKSFLFLFYVMVHLRMVILPWCHSHQGFYGFIGIQIKFQTTLLQSYRNCKTATCLIITLKITYFRQIQEV